MKVIILIIIFFTINFSGCGKQKSDNDIIKNTPVTKLSEILSAPEKYHGQKVLLNGFVSSVCTSGCDILYQEGKDTIEIYASKFKFPKMKSGKPIKIYAEVIKGERIIISALKIVK
ncbi:MAG: hypothetical protein SNJ64_00685 [Endomicrobiia bacterium]